MGPLFSWISVRNGSRSLQTSSSQGISHEVCSKCRRCAPQVRCPCSFHGDQLRCSLFLEVPNEFFETQLNTSSYIRTRSPAVEFTAWFCSALLACNTRRCSSVLVVKRSSTQRT